MQDQLDQGRELMPDPVPDPVPDRLFSTDHIERNLGRRSAQGAMITISERVVTVLLSLGGTAILARLLSLDDFGLVAMVGIVVGFVSIFRDAGLSMATVQQKTINRAQISTIFWFNVLLGLMLAVTLAALAPVVAWFYGRPELVGITLVTSTTFLLGGMMAQHQALLRRQMRFGVMASIRLAAQVVSVVVGVAAAWLGYGYWALVAGSVTMVLGTLIGSWIACPWLPGRPRRSGACGRCSSLAATSWEPKSSSISFGGSTIC